MTGGQTNLFLMTEGQTVVFAWLEVNRTVWPPVVQRQLFDLQSCKQNCLTSSITKNTAWPPVTDKLLYKVVSNTPHHRRESNSQTLVTNLFLMTEGQTVVFAWLEVKLLFVWLKVKLFSFYDWRSDFSVWMTGGQTVLFCMTGG
jgi:hypothetical protein